jgi:hypothetical protein
MSVTAISDGMPAGWGFHPGTVLVMPSADALPELPMLRFLGRRRRAQAICQALKDLPYLHLVKARHLQDRYQLNHQTAHDVLRRARGL